MRYLSITWGGIKSRDAKVFSKLLTFQPSRRDASKDYEARTEHRVRAERRGASET
jgi:hypothetical protein